jgi:hypothetical protein
MRVKWNEIEELERRIEAPDKGPLLYEIEGVSVFPVYGDDGAPIARTCSMIAQVKDHVVRQMIYDPQEMNTEQALEKFCELSKV